MKFRMKIKPYYQKPRFTLYHGNCLDILSQMPDNSIDMTPIPHFRLVISDEFRGGLRQGGGRVRHVQELEDFLV